MLKYSIIFSFLLIRFSLFAQEKDSITFEKSLTSEDLIVLNEVVKFYDSTLVSLFPNHENAPKYFLQSLGDDNLQNIKIDTNRACDLMRTLNNSTLLERSETLKYKSIFMMTKSNENWNSTQELDSVIVTVNQENDTVYNKPIFIEAFKSITSAQKMNLMEKEGYFKLYSTSSFERGIKEIENNEFLKGYLQARSAYNQLGVNYKDIAKFVANNPPAAFNDYFMKRILIYDLFLMYLKEILTCKS